MSARSGRALAAALLAAGGLAACTRPRATVPVHPAGRFFVEKGCSRCHSIRALGVAGPASAAPDLSRAVEDVPRRYGVSLEEFLQRPRSGMMSVVLAQSIALAPEERAEAARRLHVAFEEVQKASAAPPAAVPGGGQTP